MPGMIDQMDLEQVEIRPEPASPFWRPEPLSAAEDLLVQLVSEAHKQSSFRSNASTVVLQQVFLASGSYEKAISAAILTLGGMHGPVADTIEFLQACMFQNDASKPVAVRLSLGLKIPGWGNSFVKGCLDPLWESVNSHLAHHFRDMSETIGQVTLELYRSGHTLYPNPACYTAATALILKLHPEVASWLFIQLRLPAWTEILVKNHL